MELCSKSTISVLRRSMKYFFPFFLRKRKIWKQILVSFNVTFQIREGGVLNLKENTRRERLKCLYLAF